jgi:methylase of polypeptide subunit release factors
MTRLAPAATEAPARSTTEDEALAQLLRELDARDYDFVTPTPASHARVLARSPGRTASDLRDIFGWSLPFAPEAIEPELLKCLLTADAVRPAHDGRLRARYRVSRLDDVLFLHAAYPTDEKDAVFFGPDSFRFAHLIRRELAAFAPPAGATLVDIGAGAGVGAIVAARLCPGLRVTMTDINSTALRLARINAEVAGVLADLGEGPNLDPVTGAIDLALANPPYIIDAEGRDYRDGGDMHGARAAYDMAADALQRLAPGGAFILYTGSPIIAGEDRLRRRLHELAHAHSATLRYREIDPDVFGEELANPAYAEVDRIAAVGAVLTKAPA